MSKDVFFAYWEAEMTLAEAMLISYTSLADYYPEERRCHLCGLLAHTNEFGSLERFCRNDECSQMRDFWRIQGFPRFANLDHRAARTAWLKKRIADRFGDHRLSSIPEAERLVFMREVTWQRREYEEQRRGDGPASMSA